MSFADVLSDKKFIVCLGAGGVGKTTVSAAIGFLAASLGKKTLIVTIDPAKRLADAIGLRIGHKPETIKLDPSIKRRLQPMAQIDAMMLDTGAAWADLVQRLSGDRHVAKPIFANRFYQYLANDMAGSHEFVACETLYTLAHEHNYDLIVLDTPPTIHALDFLDAPERILSFLDQEAFHFFLKQKDSPLSKLGLRFLGGASGLMSRTLGKFVPGTFLQELSDFLHVFSDLYSPLIQRTRDFQLLLKSEDTAFAIVLAPKTHAISESLDMMAELERRQLPFGAFIANRVSPGAEVGPLSDGERSDWLEFLKSNGVLQKSAVELLNRMSQAAKQESDNARFETHLLGEFRNRSGMKTPFFSLPRLSHDIGSLESLLDLLPGLLR